jgi:hypothetical protein
MCCWRRAEPLEKCADRNVAELFEEIVVVGMTPIFAIRDDFQADPFLQIDGVFDGGILRLPLVPGRLPVPRNACHGLTAGGPAVADCRYVRPETVVYSFSALFPVHFDTETV